MVQTPLKSTVRSLYYDVKYLSSSPPRPLLVASTLSPWAIESRRRQRHGCKHLHLSLLNFHFSRRWWWWLKILMTSSSSRASSSPIPPILCIVIPSYNIPAWLSQLMSFYDRVRFSHDGEIFHKTGGWPSGCLHFRIDISPLPVSCFLIILIFSLLFNENSFFCYENSDHRNGPFVFRQQTEKKTEECRQTTKRIRWLPRGVIGRQVIATTNLLWVSTPGASKV